MSRLALFALLVALPALPASAAAAPLQIGSDQQGTKVQIGCDTGSPCILTQDTIGGDESVNVVPAAGRITGFRVQGVVGAFRFVVLRVVNGSLTVAAQTTDIPGAGAASDVSYTLTPAMAVQAGDFIGIRIEAAGQVGARDATADGDTNLFQFSADGNLTPEPDGPFELFLSATVDPTVAPAQPPARTPVTAQPDPLAALRAGKRPKVTIAGGAVTVSRKRVASIRITNPNGYALKGAMSLALGKVKLGKRSLGLAAGAGKAVKFKLSRKAMRRLRRRGKLRATATASLKGPIGKAGVTRKKLTLKAPARKKRKRTPSGGGGGGQTPVAGNRWVARKEGTGAYDDFRFTLNGGNITLEKPTLIFVTCFENGGSFRSSSSYEVFNLLGPWKLGNQDAAQQKRSVAVNQLVSSGERTITYKMTSTRSGNRITGKRTMSFSGSKYDVFTNTITFVNCAGTQSYEAIPG